MHTSRGLAARVISVLFTISLLMQISCALTPLQTKTPSASTFPQVSSPTTIRNRVSSLAPTRIETPMIMCTPPLCWEDEVFSCPDKCPGGCGTTCSTRTPNPNASPTPTFPAFDGICALPTPDPAQPAPRLALCASTVRLHVGDTLNLAAKLSGISAANQINIQGKDEDGPGSFYAKARTGDHAPIPQNANAHLTLLWVQTQGSQLFAVLKADSPGTIKITFRLIPTVPDIQSSVTITVLP